MLTGLILACAMCAHSFHICHYGAQTEILEKLPHKNNDCAIGAHAVKPRNIPVLS